MIRGTQIVKLVQATLGSLTDVSKRWYIHIRASRDDQVGSDAIELELLCNILVKAWENHTFFLPIRIVSRFVA